jgi:hypothetical protein
MGDPALEMNGSLSGASKMACLMAHTIFVFAEKIIANIL